MVPVPGCCLRPGLPRSCHWVLSRIKTVIKTLGKVGVESLAPGVAPAFPGKAVSFPGAVLRDGDGGGHLRPLSLRAPVSSSRWREGNA